MPHPGKKAATSPAFEGRTSEIDEEFIEQLLPLASLLLGPDNLLVKKIDGREITCQELMAYFGAYVHFIKTCPELVPQSAYEATIQASNLAAMYMARELYTIKMLKVWNGQGRVDRGTMENHHYRLLEEAEELFEHTHKLGGPKYSEHYKGKLGREIEGIFHSYAEYFKDNKTRIVDTVAFKTVHAAITTGVASAAIGLAVVELPVIAAVCGAIGAVSLTGYVYHTVDTYRRKRKKESEEANGRLRAGTTESTCDSAPEQEYQPTHTAEMPEHAVESPTTRSAEDFLTVNELENSVLFDNFANERLGK